MKFRTNVQRINMAVERILPALPKRSTIPVLEHAWFAIENDILTITATDQDLAVRTKLVCEDAEEGSVLVPGKKFYDIIKALEKDKDFELEADPVSFNIQIQSGKSKYKLKGMDTEEYLAIDDWFEDSEDTRSISFGEGELSELIKSVSFAMSKDEYRPAMSGLLLEIEGENEINAVATDSFRLAKYHKKGIKNTIFEAEKVQIILSPDGVRAVEKETVECTAYIVKDKNGDYARVRFVFEGYADKYTLVCKIIDEKYPPYENIMPESFDLSIRVPADALRQALKRLNIICDKTSNIVKLIVNQPENRLELNAEHEDIGDSGNENVDINYIDGGLDDFTVGFNLSYIYSVVSMIESDDAVLRFTTNDKPGVIMPADLERDKEFTMVTMPVRL